MTVLRMVCCSAVALLACACAREDPGPAPPAIAAYSDPAAYEPLIAAMDRADAIADPVRRCMDHPGLPNAPWPPALVEAMCRDEHTPMPQADVLRRAIQRREWDALHASYARRLSDHRSGKDAEFLLYRSFPVNSWNDPAEGEASARRWVQARPDDPFANTALARILQVQAERLRPQASGPRLRRAVSGIEASRAAARLQDEAIALASRAIAREPDLMPAYVVLMRAYIAQEKPEPMRRTLAAALARSPAAYYPREAMVYYFDRNRGVTNGGAKVLAEDAARHLGENPRLASIVSYPLLLKARGLAHADRHGPALEAWRRVLAVNPEYEALLNGGYDASVLHRDVEAVMYYSQHIRFNRGAHDALRRRARVWERNGMRERAMRDYRAVLEIDPGNTAARERLAGLQRKAVARK